MRRANPSPLAVAALALLASAAAAVPSVVASSTVGASALDLDGEGVSSEHIVKVADVVVDTPWSQGLTLSVSSGSLTKTGGTAIPYQVVTVAAGAAAPGGGAFTVPSGGTYTFVTIAAGSTGRDLYVRYAPAALQDPGTYGGTIDLVVADNP